MTINDDPHTWSTAFAESLLRDAGWKVTRGHETIRKVGKPRRVREFIAVKHPFNREAYEYDITSEDRIYSDDIRALLDNPPMLGGMRVKQNASDDFTLH